jgi:hypothetical protein
MCLRIGKRNIKNIICMIQMPANGSALSCGADNFQVAENETSSR